MTRAAAGARVAGPCYFSNGREPVCLDLTFDRAFRDEKAGADQRFITRPVVTGSITILANRIEEGGASHVDALRVFRRRTQMLA